MNKLNFSGVVASFIIGGSVLASTVMANEGVVMMRGAGASGACFGTSIFIDGGYKVLATCRDLKIALTPEQNRYVVWMNEESGKVRRLGEIVNGKLSTTTDTKFTSVFVTAETDGYGNKPAGETLLSGAMRSIDFNSAEFKAGAEMAATPTPSPKKDAKATPTVAPQDKDAVDGETANKGIGGALSTVLKIALFGFGALLLIVGVFSFISRRRAL